MREPMVPGLRDKAQKALDKGLPLFVSEFGISDASGNGSLNKTEGNAWIRFLNKNKISYLAGVFATRRKAPLSSRVR